jgi:hypothetical protein
MPDIMPQPPSAERTQGKSVRAGACLVCEIFRETLINSFSRKSDVENNTVEVINSSSFRINQRFLSGPL